MKYSERFILSRFLQPGLLSLEITWTCGKKILKTALTDNTKRKFENFFNSWVTFVDSYALVMPTRLFLVCVRFTYKCRLQRDAGQLMWKLRLPPSQTPVEAGSQTECRSDLIIFVSYQVARATWELAIDIQNMLNDESALICYSEKGSSSFSY